MHAAAAILLQTSASTPMTIGWHSPPFPLLVNGVLPPSQVSHLLCNDPPQVAFPLTTP